MKIKYLLILFALASCACYAQSSHKQYTWVLPDTVYKHYRIMELTYIKEMAVIDSLYNLACARREREFIRKYVPEYYKK